MVKYVGSVNNDGSVTSVKGHVIAFAHDGTEVLDSVIDTLPRRDLRGRLDVVFVGPKQHWTSLVTSGVSRRRFLEANSTLSIDVARVFKYLYLKKAIDARFANVKIDDTEATRAALSVLTDELLDNATIIDSAESVRIEEMAADNTAQQHDQRQHNVNTAGVAAAESVALEAVFVAPAVAAKTNDSLLEKSREAMEKVRG